ncbi:hypothetical protein E2562_017475 [Oryza meyeriana var. granulata]|uniref:Uncharacterized protein n=1 Tax=Oryza meyeriana var. granulata TaxID=110450 RepID=A0A6G1DXS0_9ORYZ|nr:hypothetical protein E2562_017475 [Oryza meyeriana var. granulata]
MQKKAMTNYRCTYYVRKKIDLKDLLFGTVAAEAVPLVDPGEPGEVAAPAGIQRGDEIAEKASSSRESLQLGWEERSGRSFSGEAASDEAESVWAAPRRRVIGGVGKE